MYEPVCCLHQSEDYKTEPPAEVQANAKLIAAAPDLLSACKAMLEAFEYAGTRLVGAEYQAKEMMVKAIAKVV
jgi:hypothetical protein